MRKRKAKRAPVRYFAHGDQLSPDQFFCALCDLFRPESHFVSVDGLRAHTPSNHVRRYRESRRIAEQYGKRRPVEFTRPLNPPNVLVKRLGASAREVRTNGRR